MKPATYLPLIALALCLSGMAKDAKRQPSRPLYKITGSPSYTRLNINNISHWLGADLLSANNPRSRQSGLEFPRGVDSTLTAVFADGLIWGGNVRDGETPAWRVGGSQYRLGTREGAIISPGVAEAPSDPTARIYRVRRDYATADLRLDAAELGLDEKTVREQYKTDWLEWPAAKGAPFYDADGDGIYTPGFRQNEDGIETPKLAPLPWETFDPAIHADEPGLANADQVVWTVANDLDAETTASVFGGPPIGLEIQLTAWGYKEGSALSHTVFKQYKLLYKGTATTSPGAVIAPMHIALFSDVDVGAFSDDLIGVDSTLSLMFGYNFSESDAIYSSFGISPPAIGYDFFQGPIIQGSAADEAIFDLRKRAGFKNRGMDGFAYEAAGDPLSPPGPLGSYQAALEWRNVFSGCIPQSEPGNCIPYINLRTGAPTRFPLSGDPVTQTGDVDGLVLSPGERELFGMTGPFSLALGDTQEIVIGTIAALGSDRIKSVALLKGYDRNIQKLFDEQFWNFQATPPKVQATGLDGKIILNWGFDAKRVALTERQNVNAHSFEGYNVYQLRNPAGLLDADNAKKIATFDLINGIKTIVETRFDEKFGIEVTVPVQSGTDSGIRYTMVVDRDAFHNQPSVNHRDFHFAVTSYYTTLENGNIQGAVESKPAIVTARAHLPSPGTRLNATFGQMLEVTHRGNSDGSVIVTVVDPTELTGDDYEVVFSANAVDDSMQTVWHLLNTTTGDTILANQTKQGVDSSDVDFPNFDGLRVQVLGAPPDARRTPNGSPAFIEVAGPNGPLTQADYDREGADFGGNNVWHSLNAAVDGGRWFLSAGGGDGTDAQLLRDNNIGNAVPFDLEWRFEGVGAGLMWWAFDGGEVGSVPFTLWNVGIGTFDDPSDDKQLIPLAASGGGTPGVYDESGGENFIGATKCYDWVFAYDGDYAVFAADAADGSIDGDEPSGDEYFSRAVVCDGAEFNVPGLNNLASPAGTTIRIFTTKPNQPGVDTFSFTTRDVVKTENSALKETDAMSRVNAFPNPYFGAGRSSFVRFTNLPANTTIRIFTLAGTLVRTLAAEEQQGQKHDWNLRNKSGKRVASGIYLAYVEMPGVGSKALKLVVVR